MSETELALGFETADMKLDDGFVLLDESGDEMPVPDADLLPATPIQSLLSQKSKHSTASLEVLTDEGSESYSSDSDDAEPHILTDPFIPSWSKPQQLYFFVRAFMPDDVHYDVLKLMTRILNKMYPEFRWNLGLLEWRPYSKLTASSIAYSYGPKSSKLNDINYAISCCIAKEQLSREQLRDDIIERSTDKSHLVRYISKEFSTLKQGSLDFGKEKKQIHEMLYKIVTAPSTDSPKSTRHASFLQYTNSNPRNIRVMALSMSVATPSMALSFSRSLSMTMPSTLTLQDISDDISNGVMSPDEFDEQKSASASFIFDTMQRENPERPLAEFQRLQALLKDNLGSNKAQYISFEHHIEDTLLMNTAALIKKECPGFIPKNCGLLSAPFTVAKAIDIKTKKCLVINIVNLFTELRMAWHYIEMLGRQYPSFIVDSTSTPSSVVKPEPLEPFCFYTQAVSITEFLNDYPLFESLRENMNFNHAIHCISSSVTHIIENVMRPLPFQPTHIINDTYSDFLLYTTAISKFVHNKIETMHPDYYHSMMMNSLACPMQLDFMIIPQCVSEPKIEHENTVITDYNTQCDRLQFGIGNDFVGDVGAKLREFGIEFVERKISEEPALFHKTLARSFRRFNLMGSKGNKARHRRFVFIIDRRNPRYDGKYSLNNNEKTWSDRLYIFSPPKFNEISKQCDYVPEGFIDRTMQYLLPLKREDDVVIGGNSVANGYVFALSYHLYQENKLKAYFHNNGCVQRFTKDEIQYYFPRLFMKVGNKFQDEMEANKNSNRGYLDMFKEINDVEHRKFHQQTMR